MSPPDKSYQRLTFGTPLFREWCLSNSAVLLPYFKRIVTDFFFVLEGKKKKLVDRIGAKHAVMTESPADLRLTTSTLSVLNAWLRSASVFILILFLFFTSFPTTKKMSGCDKRLELESGNMSPITQDSAVTLPWPCITTHVAAAGSRTVFPKRYATPQRLFPSDPQSPLGRRAGPDSAIHGASSDRRKNMCLGGVEI